MYLYLIFDKNIELNTFILSYNGLVLKNFYSTKNIFFIHFSFFINFPKNSLVID